MTDAIDVGLIPLRTGTIVDIGAAAGHNTRRLTDAGWCCVAVEFDPSLAAELGNTGTVGLRGDARGLALKTASVDGAIIIEVLEHIDDTAAVLHEAARIVRPGGRLVIAVPTGYTERVLARLHPRYTSNAGHLHTFDRRALVDALNQTGFDVTGTATKNLLPAISWIAHATLRSDADQTGTILQHLIIDRVFAHAHRVLTSGRTGLRMWAAMERHVGKSWYFYAERRP